MRGMHVAVMWPLSGHHLNGSAGFNPSRWIRIGRRASLGGSVFAGDRAGRQGSRRRTAANGGGARRRRDLPMGKARYLVKKDEAGLAKLVDRSASGGDHRKRRRRRETAVGTSSDLKKKAVPVVIFDEARVWEHLGITGR